MIIPSKTLAANQWALVIWVLRLSCFFVFIGRGWQHLYAGDAPFRTLLWDEELLTPLVNSLLSMSWNEYATSETVDHTIQTSIHVTGAFYVVCAAASLFVQKNSRWMKVILSLGSASLTFLAFLYFKEKFYHIGQFLEYASQFGAPALLVWAITYQDEGAPKGFGFALRVLVALTFICHGLYAFGYYPVPGNFVDMIVQIVGVDDDQAKSMLMLAGILDFAVSGILISGLLLPFAFIYTALWGLATAVARLLANISWPTFSSDFIQWAPEFLHRVPHATVPLAGLLLVSPYFVQKITPLVMKRSPY